MAIIRYNQIHMKLAILGANGKVGRYVTDEALRRGHEVIAVVRINNGDIDDSPTALTVFEGDATNYDDMSSILKSCDAVVSVIGHSKHTSVDMQARAMRVVTQAMTESGIDRLVTLTGNGVLINGDAPSIIDRFLLAALIFVDPKRIQDGIRHLQVLEESSVDWAVLRTPKHTNANKVSEYKIREYIQGSSLFVSRPNIAYCLLDLVEVEAIETRTPVVSNR